MTSNGDAVSYDVIVIGGGESVLAMAYPDGFVRFSQVEV
jgi:hypothetical protein